MSRVAMRGRIALAVLGWAVLACGIIAAGYLTIMEARRRAEAEATQVAETTSYLMVANFERTADAIDGFLQNFADQFDPQWSDQRVFEEVRSLAIPRSVIQLSVVDRNGRLIASNLTPSAEKVDLSDREHVRVHLNGTGYGGMYISAPLLGRVSNKWTIQFTRAIRSDAGQLIAILVASYDLEDFISFYEKLKIGEKGALSLIGLDGIVRLRTTHENSYGQDLKDTDVFRHIKETGTGPYNAVSPIDRVMRTGYFVTSSRYPFVILVAFDSRSIYAHMQPFQRLTVTAMLCLLLILSVVAVLAVWLSRLSARMRDEKIRNSVKQREAQVAQAIGRVPGVALALVGQEVVFLADSTEDSSPVTEHVRAIGARLKGQVGNIFPPLFTDRFVKDREEYELILAVSKLEDIHGRDAEATGDYLIFALDQTSKRREENQLYQMSKLASLGEVATGLAHEINQPLAVIRLAAQNAIEGVKRGKGIEFAESKLERILQQSKRITKIVDHMRIFGRQTDEPQRLFSPNDVLEGAEQTVGAHLNLEGISLKINNHCDGVSVNGRQDQIEQVVINLVQNARDSIREMKSRNSSGYTGWIEMTCREQNDGTGQFVCIQVEDNGGGIPDEITEKIFQPFFTTKPPGAGTGLGLALSYGIVREHKGSLTAKNGPAGAIFTVSLPIAQRAAKAAGRIPAQIKSGITF